MPAVRTQKLSIDIDESIHEFTNAITTLENNPSLTSARAAQLSSANAFSRLHGELYWVGDDERCQGYHHYIDTFVTLSDRCVNAFTQVESRNLEVPYYAAQVAERMCGALVMKHSLAEYTSQPEESLQYPSSSRELSNAEKLTHMIAAISSYMGKHGKRDL